METKTTLPFNPATPTSQIGFCATRGSLITVDTPLSEYFKGIHVGTGGDLLIKGMDNQIIPYLGVLSGATLFAVGYEVVSAATVNGQNLTTTAANLTWLGGA